jgi:hypothetical protein
MALHLRNLTLVKAARSGAVNTISGPTTTLIQPRSADLYQSTASPYPQSRTTLHRFRKGVVR